MKQSFFLLQPLKTAILAGLAGGTLLAADPAAAHVVYPKALYNDTGTNPAHNNAGANLTAPGTGTQTFTVSSDVGWYAGSTAGLAQASADWNSYRTGNGGIPAGATTSINGSNSHDNKFLYFALAQASTVTFSVNANSATSGQTGTGQLAPAFSIYSGLAPYLAHDGAADNSAASNYVLSQDGNGFAPFSQFLAESPVTGAGNAAALWGVYRSDASFGYGHDVAPAPTAVTTYPNGDPVSGYDYTTMNLVGYVSNDGLHSGDVAHSGSATSVTGSFFLNPGVYTLTVGGNNSAALDPYMTALFGSIGLPLGTHTQCAPNTTQQCTGFTDAVALSRKTFGFDITTTVAPVPVPAAVWLFGSALAGLVGIGRRRSAAAA